MVERLFYEYYNLFFKEKFPLGKLCFGSFNSGVSYLWLEAVKAAEYQETEVILLFICLLHTE